jgi:hypothetical protein
MVEIFEAIMVVSFGLSWPISILKTLKAKTAKGKSPFFIGLIVFGYICGITSKILNSVENNVALNYVFIFYCLNLLMTSFDLGLNIYYRRKDSKIVE